MRILYLCTTSNSKLRQFEAFFGVRGYAVRQIALELPEVQCVDPSAVARQKLRVAASLTALRPLLVDDAGLEVDGIDGLPGALLKPILEHGRVRLLAKVAAAAQRDGRACASLVSAVAVDTGAGVLEGTGTLRGMLDFRDQARLDDDNTTGVFFPDGGAYSLEDLQRRTGEAAFSHRFAAMSQIHELMQREQSRSPSCAL